MYCIYIHLYLYHSIFNPVGMCKGCALTINYSTRGYLDNANYFPLTGHPVVTCTLHNITQSYIMLMSPALGVEGRAYQLLSLQWDYLDIHELPNTVRPGSKPASSTFRAYCSTTVCQYTFYVHIKCDIASLQKLNVYRAWYYSTGV